MLKEIRLLGGATLFTPDRFDDDRGFFQENFRRSELPIPSLVQENMSFSHSGVFRGLHFQCPNWQGKLIRVIGEIMDYWIDLADPTSVLNSIGLHTGDMIYIPTGCAHGFFAAKDSYVIYSTTTCYEPEQEFTLSLEEFSEIRHLGEIYGKLIVSHKDLENGISLSRARQIATDQCIRIR